MYLDNSSFEGGVLRQGDILQDVHAVSAINLNSIQYTNDSTRSKIVSWTLPQEPRFSYVMVLSHSCEIDKANTIKLTSIILSPIRDINSATSPDKIDELKRSNIIETGTEASYLKYFFIAPHPLIPHSEGSVVDFSKCFSARKNCYDFLLSKKILQLKPDIAQKMALKLSLYFYRP